MQRDLDQPGGQLDDFHRFCPPLAGVVLFCGNANLLTSTQAFHVALVPLTDRDIFTKYNVRVGNLYAPQQVITTLYVDPSVPQGMVQRWINDAALKGSVNCPGGGTHENEQEQNGSDPAAHPINTMLSSCRVFVKIIGHRDIGTPESRNLTNQETHPSGKFCTIHSKAGSNNPAFPAIFRCTDNRMHRFPDPSQS